MDIVTNVLIALGVLLVVGFVVLAAIGGGSPRESEHERQMRMHYAAQYTKRR